MSALLMKATNLNPYHLGRVIKFYNSEDIIIGKLEQITKYSGEDNITNVVLSSGAEFDLVQTREVTVY